MLKRNIETWLTWSTCSIALMPIMPLIGNSICLIIWIGLTLLFRIVNRAEPSAARGDKWLFLLFGGNFIFLLLSLCYSINIPAGIDMLVTELPMILFPLGFFLIGLPPAEKAGLLKKVFFFFWLSTLILTIWIFFNYQRLHLFAEIGKASSLNLVFRETAAKASDRDADYLSIYLAFSIFLAAGRLFSVKNPAQRLVYGVSILLMGALLLLLAARSPIIGLVAGSIIICFLRLKKGITRWVVSLSLLVSMLLLIRLTPAIYSRILEVRDTPLKAPVGVYTNSTNLRVGIYQCSWQLIQQHLPTGIGVGSDRKMLQDCYLQFPTDAYQKVFYNTHDQYLNFWLLSGIGGILLFLSLLFYAFLSSLKRGDHIYLFFLVLMSLSFLTENVLSRQAGVVFFYFFICLLENSSKKCNFRKSPKLYK